MACGVLWARVFDRYNVLVATKIAEGPKRRQPGGPTARHKGKTTVLVASNRTHITAIPRHNQDFGANVFAHRCFVLPENASMKKGPALTTGPQIYKAPNYHERTLCNEFSI